MRKWITPMIIAGIVGYSLTTIYLMGKDLTTLKKENIALIEELDFINAYFNKKYRLNATTYIMNTWED